MSSNMPIWSSLLKRINSSQLVSHGKSPKVPSKNSNKKGTARKRKRKSLRMKSNSMNLIVLKYFSN